MIHGYARCSPNESKQDINRQMQNAIAKGRKVGRRPTTKESILAVFMKYYPAYVSKQINVSEFARLCGLSRLTV